MRDINFATASLPDLHEVLTEQFPQMHLQPGFEPVATGGVLRGRRCIMANTQ